MRWYRKFFGTPTPAEFGALATAALARTGATEIQFEESLFFLRYQIAGDSHIANLHNAFAMYRDAKPWQRSRVLSHFFGRSVQKAQAPDSWTEAAPHVQPAVRDRFLFEVSGLQARLHGNGSAQEVVSRELSDRLCMCLVYDGPDFMIPVTLPMLARWGVSFEEARDWAFANLRQATTQARWECPLPGLYVSAWQDDYDSSRLLLDEILQGVEVQGVPVAFVPHRNQLILTGSEDLEALAKALLLAEAGASSPSPMSALPLRRTPDGWASWELPRNHPHRSTYNRLRILEWGGLYLQQGELLDEIHRLEGVDVHVASFGSLQDKKSGDLRSWTSWARGVAALLPRTDLIGLADPEKPEGERFLGLFAWDLVERCCGPLLQPTRGDFPVRYRVESFPSAEQLRELAEGKE